MTVISPLGQLLRDEDGMRLEFVRTYDDPIADVWSALTDRTAPPGGSAGGRATRPAEASTSRWRPRTARHPKQSRSSSVTRRTASSSRRAAPTVRGGST